MVKNTVLSTTHCPQASAYKMSKIYNKKYQGKEQKQEKLLKSVYPRAILNSIEESKKHLDG